MPFDRQKAIDQIQCMAGAAAGLAFIAALHGALGTVIHTALPDPDFIRRTFVHEVTVFRPEPLERTTFLLSTALIPLVLFGILFLTEKLVLRLPDNTLRAVSYSGLGLMTAAATILCLRFPPKSRFFAEVLPATAHPALRLAAGFLLAWIVLNSVGRLHRFRGHPAINAAVLWAMFLALCAALFPLTWSGAASPTDFVGGAHFDATVYSIAQVMYGKAMLINLDSQYGLYPQIIEPLFRVAGLNIGSLTLFFWLLICLSYGSLVLFLRGSIRSTLLTVITLVAVVYYGYFSSRFFKPNEPYFQYHPIRLLFPCLGLFLFGQHIRRQSCLTYWLACGVAVVGILWNPDTGVVVFGTWLVLLAYKEFATNTLRVAAAKTITHLGRGLFTVCVTALIFSVYMRVRYHSWPDFTLFSPNSEVFYWYGLMMLPLPPSHPWILVITVYVVGLTWAICCLIRRHDLERAQLILAVTVLGIGLFAYYQGRSHDANLPYVIYPALILLGLFVDGALGSLRAGRRSFQSLIQAVPVYAALFVLCFPVVLLAAFGLDRKPWATATFRQALPVATATAAAAPSAPRRLSWLKNDVQFIAAHSRPGASVGIISNRAGVYYMESRSASLFDGPGLTELLWRSQENALLRQITNLRDTPIFYDAKEVSDGHFPDAVVQLLIREWRETSQNLDTGGNLALFEKVPASEPRDSMRWRLPEVAGEPGVLHVRTGRSGFLVDGQGNYAGFQRSIAPPVAGLATMVIEAVIKPEGLAPAGAVVFSTQSGLRPFEGFAFRGNPEKEGVYNLEIGNGLDVIRGPDINLPASRTSYLAIDLRAQVVVICLNGANVAQFEVPGGLINSRVPLTVGNSEDYSHPFEGRVMELYIRNGQVTPAGLASRWRLIQADEH